MTPTKKGRKGPKPAVRTGPRATDVHEVVFYARADGTMPAREYLARCPKPIAARIRAVAAAVAEAPPTRFAGGGMWEAMHGVMTGWFEIRVDGPPSRSHYRVFCLLDTKAEGAERPYLVLVDGRTKAYRTVLADSEYLEVRALGDRYWASKRRPIG